MQKKLKLKARQTNPDSPPELIRQYQVVVNVLDHYSRSSSRGSAIPISDDYFRNVHKAPGITIVGRWMNVKKLLKRGTYIIIDYSHFPRQIYFDIRYRPFSKK